MSNKSKNKNFWIPRKIKKGALSKMLKISEDATIPMLLLWRIKKAKVGTEVINEWGVGKQYIKVTALLKKRAVLAYTLKKMGRRK